MSYITKALSNAMRRDVIIKECLSNNTSALQVLSAKMAPSSTYGIFDFVIINNIYLVATNNNRLRCLNYLEIVRIT